MKGLLGNGGDQGVLNLKERAGCVKYGEAGILSKMANQKGDKELKKEIIKLFWDKDKNKGKIIHSELIDISISKAREGYISKEEYKKEVDLWKSAQDHLIKVSAFNKNWDNYKKVLTQKSKELENANKEIEKLKNVKKHL